jgi:hypothetical protein
VRTVFEYQLRAETSIGRIEGILWSDGELGLTSSQVTELERRNVKGPVDLALAVRDAGVPGAEATTVANVLWETRPPGFRKQQERERRKQERRQRKRPN